MYVYIYTYIYIYIYIFPQEVQRSLLHPSQAPPAHAYTVGSKGRPGVSMSRLLAGLQASLAVSVKVRIDAL